MALSTEETTYLAELYAIRTKLLTGTLVTDSQDRTYADPPTLPYINREIQRLENKSDVVEGGRRVNAKGTSDNYG